MEYRKNGGRKYSKTSSALRRTGGFYGRGGTDSDEKKFFDTVSTAEYNVGATAAVVSGNFEGRSLFLGLQAGTEFNNRIGSKITITSIHIKGQIRKGKENVETYKVVEWNIEKMAADRDWETKK